MINIACIVTSEYIERALTMFNSMLNFRNDCQLDLLVVTGGKQDTCINLKNVNIHHISDFYNHEKYGHQYRNIISKHSVQNVKNLPKIITYHDYLRWSLKPVFVNILLEKYQKVFFCDSDLFFYSDFTFLDEESEDKSMTLSPHWRTIFHTKEMEWEYNYKHGLYNGGFFIVTRKGVEIMNWWSEMCAYECTAKESFTYVDQKYLDVVPLYFDDVHVIKHKGCNVASWNRIYLERTIVNNEVLVGGDPIIFIHYSPITIKHIEDGNDLILQDHLSEYMVAIKETKQSLVQENYEDFTLKYNSIDLV